jgi:hypothetical protein
VVVGLAGCGTDTGADAAPTPAPPLDRAAFDARGAEVVATWKQTPAAGVWRDGLVPLVELSRPPAGGFPDCVLRAAFTSGWFRTEAPLPTGRPRARSPDGTPLTVPVLGAAEAVGAVRHPPHCLPAEPSGPSPPSDGAWCGWLTITALRLDTTTVLTSRGAATVPAWRLTVRELPEPVWRVAVAPSAITPLPVSDRQLDAGPEALVGAMQLVGSQDRTLRMVLTIGSCGADLRAMAVRPFAKPQAGGMCDAMANAPPAR